MAILKCTLFFRQTGYGWTESYFKDVADLDLSQFQVVSYTLAEKRIKVSGEQTELYAIRLSKEGPFRDVYVQPVTMKGTRSHASDVPHTTLTYGMQNATRLKRKFIFVRGVWDGNIDTGGVFTPDATYVPKINTWRNEVITQAWGWMGTASTQDAFVSGVTVNANGTIRLTFATDLFPAPYPRRTSIRLSGLLGCFQLNGLQPVVATDARTCDTKFPMAIFPWTAGGKGRFSGRAFVPAAFVDFEKVSRRAAGRPSYLTPGRQRARPRR